MMKSICLQIKLVYASFITVLFVLSSCCFNDKTIIHFDKEKELELVQKIPIDSCYLSYPTMVICDSLCCIADPSQRDCFFTLYSYPEFRFIRKLGAIGNGNGEISMYISFDLINGNLFALSSADNRVYVYELDSLSKYAQYTINLDDNAGISSLCIGPNETIFGNSLTGKKQLIQINKEGRIIKEFIPLPKNEETMPRQLVNNNWQCLVSYNDNTKTLVSAAIYGDNIDIINFINNDVKIKRLEGDLGSPKIFKNARAGYTSYMQQYDTYRSIFVNNNIYALFCKKDYSQDRENNLENCVKEFDINGEPITKYLFDKKLEPSSFYVDEANRFVFLLLPEEEYPIWKFKI